MLINILYDQKYVTICPAQPYVGLCMLWYYIFHSRNSGVRNQRSSMVFKDKRGLNKHICIHIIYIYTYTRQYSHNTRPRLFLKKAIQQMSVSRSLDRESMIIQHNASTTMLHCVKICFIFATSTLACATSTLLSVSNTIFNISDYWKRCKQPLDLFKITVKMSDLYEITLGIYKNSLAYLNAW